MIHPSFEEFRGLARKGNLIPVYRELLADTYTPVTAFLKLGGSPAFLLESVEGGEKWARYTFLGSRPSKIIKGKGTRIEIIEDQKTTRTLEVENPLHVLRGELSRFMPVEVPGLPRFFGGLVGYMGYDIVRFFERLPEISGDGIDTPDFFFMITDTILIFDSLKQKIKIVSNAHLEGHSLEDAYAQAVQKIDEIILRLQTPLTVKDTPLAVRQDGFRSNIAKEDFMKRVEKAQEYIRAGDIFQVVLSQRFQRPSLVTPFNIYRALRVINPSPYMYYLDIGDAQLVGSSPEILVRLEGGKIVLRPIAGTRKRGETDALDAALEKELKGDPKENAEHIMLVDLGRNDVGRVAEMGSVKVTELMTVERYSHVMHLVSHVEGTIRDRLDAFDVLAAAFPAGTVTGAPKIRAMEIIGELEQVRRGPYAGTVGYFSYSGNMDTCITIRTLLIKDNTVFVQAGAGIVADSDPEAEYMETVNKAKGMMKAVDMAEQGLQ